MLTRLTIRNFKRFEEVSIDLGGAVVFTGPNKSGKTSALQALALWQLGLRKWLEKRTSAGKDSLKRPGVALNRRDIVSIPVSDANLLWRDLHVRNVSKRDGKQKTENVRIDILVQGAGSSGEWECGLEFDYANQESIYCRPLRLSDAPDPERMPVPVNASETNVAYLPPMSGLTGREFVKQSGELAFLIGQGKTADVLRNLCFQVMQAHPEEWLRITKRVHALFGLRLHEPRLFAERSEILMTYSERSVELDLSSAGRGVQQTLLLLAFLALNRNSVLLLDEPDAHLEILRQRQIYNVLTEAAAAHGSQIIAASHSEVLLNEAAGRDLVIAFLGKPHRIDDRGSQLSKSLKDIGFEHYYQAEQRGWVLYLEGSTDLSVLRTFANLLGHPVATHLEQPFVKYIANDPQQGRQHFHGLREAKPDLSGFLLCDRLERQLQSSPELTERCWKRREIENYFCNVATLLRFAGEAAKEHSAGPLYAQPESDRWTQAMQRCLEDLVPRVALRDPNDQYWKDEKASALLDRLFERFYREIGVPGLFRKADYHRIATVMQPHEIDPEVNEVLDDIMTAVQRARPLE